jgi:hypothetical protein
MSIVIGGGLGAIDATKSDRPLQPWLTRKLSVVEIDSAVDDVAVHTAAIQGTVVFHGVVVDVVVVDGPTAVGRDTL